MAYITSVKLLSVPKLSSDYQHTLWFDNYQQQITFFESKVVKSFDGFTYQKKDNIVRLPVTEDYMRYWNVNYIMYKNESADEIHSGRWYFAFVKSMTYKNEGVTEVELETDVIQTWLTFYEVMPSFIEREHIGSDKIGVNVVEEGLQLSEYVVNSHQISKYAGNDTSESSLVYLWDSTIVVGVTQEYDDGKMVDVSGTMYNGIYSGVKYFCFENDISSNTGIKALDAFLEIYAREGAIDAIVCMFLAPKKLAYVRSSDGAVNHAVVAGNTPDGYYINSSDTESATNRVITFSNSLDGYTPKNKKLLTYPYRYILATNNSGASVIYNYEDFYTVADGVKTVNTPQFKIEACLTPGCSIRMTPKNYKGAYRNDDEGINMGKYPILNWSSDVYTNWLTQNGLNIAISVGASALQIAGGIAMSVGTGGAGALMGAGSVAAGISGIASTLGEVHKQSMTPPQSEGNINSGDVVTATGRNDFHFYEMSIKAESAAIIDDYFNMYGYKTNRVKRPNENHRENWWYTKTINANIVASNGGIPNADIEVIKKCYNSGITFWKTYDNMFDYSLSNEYKG